ncbi:hypothetical protein [Pseudomonas sp. BLCC-B112]|uniref:hypothetical protein n=1 Tax=Pseudomonas sp. BLCC-B112 TaxID=3025319 RepID=UPI00234D00B9|nr:hypothetical protein [Pseudomonas sp. BLCC-B112]MDC7815664.1 hypothetical protein [Pseudomonas sp. BLCC-B112]
MSFEKYTNTTHNQHFVSQAEQRVNSYSSAPSKGAGIYCFDILDKKEPTVRPGRKKSIEKNLSFQDLFTIARVGDKERVNFEAMFKRYEDGYPAQVSSLLDWVALARGSEKAASGSINLEEVKGQQFFDLLGYVKYIYTYKVMNWLRNPYKIREVIRNFAPYVDHCIDSPEALRLYLALASKSCEEEKYICKVYGVLPGEYRQWIRLLLLFLYSDDRNKSSLDGYIEEFFSAKEFVNMVHIHVFDSRCALLTDTGVVKDSSSDGLVAYMNVSSSCVLSIQHAFVEGRFLDLTMKQLNIPESDRDKCMAALGGKIHGVLRVNDIDILAGYNKICVKAAARQVFSASAEIDGVKISS